MKKKKYTPPLIELFPYRPEEGYATSIGLTNNDVVPLNEQDYVLVEGEDRGTNRAADEFTEYTDNSGQYESGLWTF